MSEPTTCLVEVQGDKTDMRGTAVGRRGVITQLKATAYVLERDLMDEKVERIPEGVANAQELAERLNEANEWYVCDCGRVFETQSGFAGHRNWCAE